MDTGMKKDSHPDRRSLTRNVASIEVEFHVWDKAEKRSLTRKVSGRLTDISSKGACLQTNQTMIDGYHLMLHEDLEGGTPLILAFPSSPEDTPFSIKAQVLWYNRVAAEEDFHFQVGLKFIDLSPPERKQIETLLKSASAAPKA